MPVATHFRAARPGAALRDVRLFTPEEANGMLPRVRPLLVELRESFEQYRFARSQVEDLRKMYGEDPADVPGHPEESEAARWHQRAEDTAAQVQSVVDEFTSLGIHVKDPLLGLIDFYARRRDGEIVLLCFRDDEERITHWHPIEGGFAARRPLDEL